MLDRTKADRLPQPKRTPRTLKSEAGEDGQTRTPATALVRQPQRSEPEKWCASRAMIPRNLGGWQGRIKEQTQTSRPMNGRKPRRAARLLSSTGKKRSTPVVRYYAAASGLAISRAALSEACRGRRMVACGGSREPMISLPIVKAGERPGWISRLPLNSDDACVPDVVCIPPVLRTAWRSLWNKFGLGGPDYGGRVRLSRDL